MGCVYVLSNPAMPGMLKVGCTTRELIERVAELSAHTGVPLPFVVEYSFDCDYPFLLEHGTHEILGGARVSLSREFFAVPVDYAVRAIEQAAASEMYWRRALFTVWNRGAQDWRERALETLDGPVFDRTAAG